MKKNENSFFFANERKIMALILNKKKREKEGELETKIYKFSW